MGVRDGNQRLTAKMIKTTAKHRMEKYSRFIQSILQRSKMIPMRPVFD